MNANIGNGCEQPESSSCCTKQRGPSTSWKLFIVFCFPYSAVLLQTSAPCPRWVFPKQSEAELSGKIWGASSVMPRRHTVGTEALMWFLWNKRFQSGLKGDERDHGQLHFLLHRLQSEGLFPCANRSWTLGNRASSETSRPPSPPLPWPQRLLLWRPLMTAGTDTIRSAPPRPLTLENDVCCRVLLNTHRKSWSHTLQFLFSPVGYIPRPCERKPTAEREEQCFIQSCFTYSSLITDNYLISSMCWCLVKK